jgi:TetR/AcrR family transcriptional regulator, cholesterol catabolism regulator
MEASEVGNEDSSSMGRRRTHARRAPSNAYIERRQRLLSAAADVFREKGLEASSINDIAARFDADRATVYYYYSSKHEIFLALVTQAVEENVALGERIAKSGGSATARLHDLIESLLTNYERHYPFIHLYIQEDMRRLSDGEPAGAALKELGQRYEAAVMRIIQSGINSGEFHPDLDPQLAMFAVLGAVNWTHRWFAPGGRLSGAEVGKAFAGFFLQGFRVPDNDASSQ